MDDLPARNKEDAQKRAIALLKNLGIGVRIGGDLPQHESDQQVIPRILAMEEN